MAEFQPLMDAYRQPRWNADAGMEWSLFETMYYEVMSCSTFYTIIFKSATTFKFALIQSALAQTDVILILVVLTFDSCEDGIDSSQGEQSIIELSDRVTLPSLDAEVVSVLALLGNMAKTLMVRIGIDNVDSLRLMPIIGSCCWYDALTGVRCT